MIRYTTTGPADYDSDLESFLYNQEVFLRLKSAEDVTFYALDEKKKKIIAKIRFTIDHLRQEAVSLAQSPFGSVELIQHTPPQVLFHLIALVKKTFAEKQLSHICIKDCIPAYRTYGNDLVSNVFQQHGFACESRPNHHLLVDAQPFEAKVHPMEKKRLRKCSKAGFRCLRGSLDQVTYIYKFIQKCRQEKGWHLSMTSDEVIKSFETLPEYYKIFAVYDGRTCIAACIVVQVNLRVMYIYAQDSLSCYNPYSPVVYLLAHLYQYCQQQDLCILDMGTSPSDSLQAFKIHVGGIASAKPTWLYYLNHD